MCPKKEISSKLYKKGTNEHDLTNGYQAYSAIHILIAGYAFLVYDCFLVEPAVRIDTTKSSFGLQKQISSHLPLDLDSLPNDPSLLAQEA